MFSLSRIHDASLLSISILISILSGNLKLNLVDVSGSKDVCDGGRLLLVLLLQKKLLLSQFLFSLLLQKELLLSEFLLSLLLKKELLLPEFLLSLLLKKELLLSQFLFSLLLQKELLLSQFLLLSELLLSSSLLRSDGLRDESHDLRPEDRQDGADDCLRLELAGAGEGGLRLLPQCGGDGGRNLRLESSDDLGDVAGGLGLRHGGGDGTRLQRVDLSRDGAAH